MTIDEAPGSLGRGTPADPRLVIEAWLAVPYELEWRCLLLHRTPASGDYWQGVSGRVEAFDASLRAAALREIREETGIEGVEIVDLGRMRDFRGLLSGTYFRSYGLGAVLPPGITAERVRLSDEHDAVALLTFEEARSRLRFEENVRELLAWEARLPARKP